MARYRADLIETAWETESVYGTAPTAVDKSFGLLTGGITLPDPRYEWEPFYGIGVDDRNLLTYIQGRQVFEGSFPSIYLCHDNSRLLLEQAMGLMFNANITGSVVTGTTPTTSQITMTGIQAHAVSAGAIPTHIVVISQDNSATPDPFKDTWAYIGATSSTNVVTVHHTRNTTAATDIGWQGKFPTAANVKGAVYSIARSAITANNGATGLLAPDNVTHTSSIGIREALKQPSFTLAAKIAADNGQSLITNFTGCKAGGLSLTMEEGRPVTVSMDFTAQDMSHNMPGGATDTVMKFLATGSIKAPSMTPVTEQPYFFSKADIKFGGVTFAKFRRLTITISNALDPRYYVTQSANADNRQVLTEILEGRRTVTVSGSIDMDDANAGVAGGMQNGPDIKMLQYLLNQGFTDADVRDNAILAGISLEVELRKNADNVSALDTMTFTLPGKTTAVSPTNPGLVFNSARFPLPGPNQIHQNIEIDAVARGMRIAIRDSV